MSHSTAPSALLISLVLLSASAVHAKEPEILPIHDGVGGDFAAPSSLGRVVSSKEFRGKVVLLFFGYTSCQDVCPATLAHLKTLTTRLSDAGDDVQVLFVTIDPEVDTAENLGEYLSHFDDDFIGITGTREEVDRIARLFMVEHAAIHGMKVTTEHNRHKAFADRAYLYSHSQQIYLLDKEGRTRAFFFTGSPVDEMESAVRALLRE